MGCPSTFPTAFGLGPGGASTYRPDGQYAGQWTSPPCPQVQVSLDQLEGLTSKIKTAAHLIVQFVSPSSRSPTVVMPNCADLPEKEVVDLTDYPYQSNSDADVSADLDQEQEVSYLVKVVNPDKKGQYKVHKLWKSVTFETFSEIRSTLSEVLTDHVPDADDPQFDIGYI